MILPAIGPKSQLAAVLVRNYGGGAAVREPAKKDPAWRGLFALWREQAVA
jgi:hypothetical protein